MRDRTYLDEAPLEVYPEWEALDPELAGEAWEEEISRSSPEYVRWVQRSLNRIMGLRLTVDGVLGPATRSSIRDFQQRSGLMVDGAVGPQTEQALVGRVGPPPSIVASANPLLFEFGGGSPLNTLSPSEFKAVRITSTFETGRAGSFGGLTGNFDGQGVSFGLMNFAWKAGSLVTLLKELLRDHSAAFAEVFGSDADRLREIVLATKPDARNPKLQVRDVDRQMEFARNVLNDANNRIREPWRTYFRRLETNPEFQQIQVKAVRKAAERARYWCDYFGLKTERAFAFMFDLVSSHGGAWLNAKKFKGRHIQKLHDMLEKKKAEVGRTDLTELEKLEVIANMIADVSNEKWREKVRVRKLWFVRGSGKVHGRFWDLAKDFGVTDAPPDFGRGVVSAPAALPIGSVDILGVSASLPPFLADAVKKGVLTIKVAMAIANGERDVNKITDMIFLARHSERDPKQKIQPYEKALAREWLEIRDHIVPRILDTMRSRPVPSASLPYPTLPSLVREGTNVIFGIDTASVASNKNPNWAQAKAQVPLSFAIIRSNYGSCKDSVFERDWPQIKNAGIVRGAYLFLTFPHVGDPRCTSDPVSQAKAFIRTVKKLDETDLPPTIDIEFSRGRRVTGLTAQQCLDRIRAAWTVLKDYYGTAPMIYTSARVWHEDLQDIDAPDLVESPLWLAKPWPFKKGSRAVRDPAIFASGRLRPKVPPQLGDATNWWFYQYQGDAVNLPGFPTGNVDMDRFNTMVKGATGDRVRWVQRRLGIAQNGQFDDTMDNALRAFQGKKGLVADSVIDVRTFAYLCWSNPSV